MSTLQFSSCFSLLLYFKNRCVLRYLRYSKGNVMLQRTKIALWLELKALQVTTINSPDKASFGLVVQNRGVFHELEGTWDGCGGTLSILHCDSERVRGHLICSVFSCPAGDHWSKLLPAKTRTALTQFWLARRVEITKVTVQRKQRGRSVTAC